MSVIGAGVSLKNLHNEAWMFTFNLKAGIVAADIGKAVAIDSAADNTVKLVGDGDVVFGRLETVENRVVEGVLVGTIAIKGGYTLPYTGSPVVGSALKGSATAGSVQPLATTQEDDAGAVDIDHSKHDGRNVVVEVDATAVTVTVIML
jgi:hypothetical protein